MTNGIYSVKFNNDYPGHLIKIQAQGYLPVISEAFKVEDLNNIEDFNITYDFKLVKGLGNTGFVYNPDGTAATSAKVYLAKPNSYMQFKNTILTQGNGSTAYQTDSNGKFNMLPEIEKFQLLIFEPNGFAVVDGNDFIQDSNIYLQEWASVEGYCYLKGQPLKNQEISISYHNQSQMQRTRINYNYSISLLTDSNGFFESDQIPEGRIQVSQMERQGRNTTSSNMVMTYATSGETTKVQLGGDGITIIGKIIPPKDYEAFSFANMRISASPVREVTIGGHKEIMEKIKQYYPENIDSMTIKERMEWSQNWATSDECKALQKELMEMQTKKNKDTSTSIHKSTKANSDGTFEMNDLEPGQKYQLTGNYHNFQNNNAKRLHFSQKIELPQMEAVVDKTFDLGEIRFDQDGKTTTIHNWFETDVETLDGQKLSLSKFKGKTVLINLWQVWEQSKENFEQLQELHDKLGQRDCNASVGIGHFLKFCYSL